MMRPDGLLSFPLTPFTPDDRLDLPSYREHLDRQLAGGPGALFVACGTGEFSALSLGEYRSVVLAAVDAAGGRVPIFAGAGGGPAVGACVGAAVGAAACCCSRRTWFSHRPPGTYDTWRVSPPRRTCRS